MCTENSKTAEELDQIDRENAEAARARVVESAAESVRAIVNDFAAAAIKGSEAEALALVDVLFLSASTEGLARLLSGMTSTESLNFGRSLSDDWAEINADNEAFINDQRAALANILAVLINTGAVSLMGKL